MAWSVLCSPGSFGGVDILKRYTNWSEREAKEFLAKRDTNPGEFVFLVARRTRKVSEISTK